MKNFCVLFGLLFASNGFVFSQATNVLPTTGNVGVGTLSPIHKLEVKDGDLYLNTSAIDGGVIRSFGHILEFKGANDNNYAHRYYRFYPSPGVAGATYSVLELYSGKTDLFFDKTINITSSGYTYFNGGNVGIGTTTPRTKLDIANGGVISSGTMLLSGNAVNSGNTSLILKNGSEGGGVIALSSGIPNVSESGFSINQLNSGYVYGNGIQVVAKYLLAVSAVGNVGIGTRNPQANLQVGESTGDGLISVGGYSFLGSIRSSGHIFMGSNVYAKYNSSNEDGVVRVKSATPSGFSMIQSGGDGKITFYGKAGQVNADEQANSLNNLGLFVDGSKGVGIGTTSLGTCKLAVEGTIGAREVVVTATTPWPDYVFAPEYKLRTLDEIEQFVKAKQHLPDVPSAEMIAKYGVNLGEMNAILLKKVEELTLHLIEQNKKVESVIEQNKALLQEVTYLKGLVVK